MPSKKDSFTGLWHLLAKKKPMQSLCGRTKGIALTTGVKDVTCKRCIHRMNLHPFK